ncbi:hypothetical protein FOZ63_011040 [Perkinsus olseni]|uniref:Uncharacterized protein n=1 Tax=Perkinsus olseni TaxID=32597 RepID=A0A7J6R070_PEROL|nr:hypothetical protein FOZ63_011040 [Perkinsus olseni]
MSPQAPEKGRIKSLQIARKRPSDHTRPLQCLQATPLLNGTPAAKQRPSVASLSPGRVFRQFRDFLEDWVPLIGVLKRYKRSDADVDLKGGITLGLITISQSIAHAHIAHVSLINGPYSCVWPVLM